MSPRPTILFLMPHLGGGGAERVIAHLARSLPCDRFVVHVGLVTQKAYPTEILPPGVLLHEIGASRVLFGAIGIVRMVRQLRPDLIISGMFHLNFLVLMLRPLFPRNTRVLVRQNGMFPARVGQSGSRLTLRLYRTTYSRANGVICQTREMATEMMSLLGSKAKVHKLRNPVDVNGIRQVSEGSPGKWAGCGPHVLAVGRLSAEKGFDLLLDAFAVVRTQFPSAELVILGQGAEEHALRIRSTSLGLRSCVLFAGYAAEPALWFAGASLLVVASRQDAFPNVLLEGAAASLPIVSTPCSTAVIELLQSRPGTWLARDVSSGALAKSLLTALAKLQPGERFRHSWLEPYELGNAVAEYIALIDETLAGPAR